MEDIEKKLSELIDKKMEESSKELGMKNEIMGEFDNKVKTVKWITWMFLVIEIAIMIAASNYFFVATSTKNMLLAVVLFLIGFNSTILMKLWYWIVNSRIRVQKDIKELKFLLAENKD